MGESVNIECGFSRITGPVLFVYLAEDYVLCEWPAQFAFNRQPDYLFRQEGALLGITKTIRLSIN